MITEDYVSFETAKLLKKKGFNYTVHQYYKENGEVCNNPKSVASWRVESWYPCATLQIAMKWLREIHNIHVVPKFDFYAGDYTGRIYDGRRESTSEKDDYMAIVGNRTHEQACEAGIKYCLENLI
jgi:hypothetical protein